MSGETRDRETVLADYAAGPARLEAVIAGLAEAGLDLALAADSWSIRQIVHHVVDGDDLWKTCIKAALGNPEATFSLPWYWDVPQERWAECWNYARLPVGPSLARFRSNRRHIVELLGQIPDALSYCATVRWPDEQQVKVTVAWVVEMQARHVEQHAQDIQAIRKAHHLEGIPEPMQQYLYRIQPTRPEMLTEGPAPEEQAIVGEHFDYLQDLTEKGVVILAGRTLNTDPSSFGLVVFQAQSEAEARETMENDPAVRNGVMRAELYPYRLALMREVR